MAEDREMPGSVQDHEDELRAWLMRTVGSASTLNGAKQVVERLVADALRVSGPVDPPRVQAPGETPQPEDDIIMRWECPVCGWSIADENAGGEGQSCEAWMLDDEAGEHGACRPVRYLREGRPGPVDPAETRKRTEIVDDAIIEDLTAELARVRAERDEAAESRENLSAWRAAESARAEAAEAELARVRADRDEWRLLTGEAKEEARRHFFCAEAAEARVSEIRAETVAAVLDMLETVYSVQGHVTSEDLHPADALDKWALREFGERDARTHEHEAPKGPARAKPRSNPAGAPHRMDVREPQDGRREARAELPSAAGRLNGSSPDADGVRAPDGMAGRVDGAVVTAFDWQAGDPASDCDEHGRGRKWIARAGDYTGALGATRRDGVAVSGLPQSDVSAYDPLPDGRRYAACGDGVVASVAEWLGRRLAEYGKDAA